jgi:glutamate racemase
MKLVNQYTCEQVESIGIFDSGLGGLTVFKRVVERMPRESIIYLGDTARVPYGAKSADTVIRYARGCARILLERGVNMLVVACNTASACALDALRDELDVPVIGVIEPGAGVAARKTRNKRIGVIGTESTIRSEAYVNAIHAIDSSLEVFRKPCPLFVPLVEEGWTSGTVAEEVARIYLKEMVSIDVDTLVLGCTHYPLLREVIAKAMGPGVTLVDSAEATAQVVAEVREGMGGPLDDSAEPHYKFLVTDSPDSFARVGRRFLGNDIVDVEWVDF